MPIRPYLAGQAIEAEVIREMSLALETVARSKSMTNHADA